MIEESDLTDDIKKNINWLHERSQKTKSDLETHEAVCAERWKETILRIKRIEHIMIGTAGTMIVMMAGLLLR